MVQPLRFFQALTHPQIHTRSQNPPPPIESFAFSKSVHIIESSSSEELGDAAAGNGKGKGKGNEFEDLEDEDADLEVSNRVATVSRGNRFVIEDDEDEDDDGDGKVGDFSDHEVWLSEEEAEEEDVVKKALRKCEKISAELKRELYGTSSAACDRYSEVEMGSSAARIVTQEDVNEACGSADLDFKPMLKPYQLIGVNFLLLLYRKKIEGAILADEMGLGKTVQAITYLTLLKHLEDDPGPHLIVCPASVLENWERELKKWSPSFTVLQYHGSARSAYSKELSSLGKAGLPPPFDVILVCYSLFERHSAQQKDDRKILRHWKWSCVLMDEAHALKDKNSYRWKNLMSVARNARQRLMLTGTPLQNDLHVEYVYMAKQQEDAYKEAIENYRAISQARIMKSSETCPRDVASILPRRQISNYFLEFRKLLLYYGDADTGILSDEHVMVSAKCRALAELLPVLNRSGSRVLIFSQWTSMLDILEWTLDVIGVTYRRLDGRLVTKDTVDENIYEIAKRKLILDAAVLESGVEVENEGEMPDKTMAEILSSLLLQ
ncbi:UNVERIFIED_CONTAM: protein CHROMATIN REMODELING 19 [Sesamum radiatum]|uniref:Protein CHROMATIN REMODELING 19 n=1 Tax=Sesamum radiatum TaxID=300843 RepID=A0AAW2JPP4_SESRA